MCHQVFEQPWCAGTVTDDNPDGRAGHYFGKMTSKGDPVRCKGIRTRFGTPGKCSVGLIHNQDEPNKTEPGIEVDQCPDCLATSADAAAAKGVGLNNGVVAKKGGAPKKIKIVGQKIGYRKIARKKITKAKNSAAKKFIVKKIAAGLAHVAAASTPATLDLKAATPDLKDATPKKSPALETKITPMNSPVKIRISPRTVARTKTEKKSPYDEKAW